MSKSRAKNSSHSACAIFAEANRTHGWTISIAESLTGGRLQALLTAESGASRFFLGGLTAYGLAQKQNLLGVEKSLLEKTNGVSELVAEQMAHGAIRLFGSEWAAATTGYAEADPANKIAAPFAFWAIASRISDKTKISASGTIDLSGFTRTEAQQRASEIVCGELEQTIAAALRAKSPSA